MLNLIKRLLKIRLINFMVVGSIGGLISFAVYYPLTFYFKSSVLFLGQIFYLPAVIPSTIAGVTFNYYLNKKWTYGDCKTKSMSLSKDIDASKSKLKMLKPGSADYLSGMKDVLDKQGSLQAKQEYFKRQMDMREQAVIEQLFKDVIKATAGVAKEKGFDLVFEKSELDLPASNSNELTLTISTYKVLYNAGCEDITDAVMAKVDANSI